MRRTCGTWAAKNTHKKMQLDSKAATDLLREVRGFGVEPASTCTRAEAMARTRTSKDIVGNRESVQQQQLAALLSSTRGKARSMARK